MTLTPEERAEHLIAPEEVLESERSSLVTGMVIARAWRDPDYLDRLLSRPAEVLTAAGLEIPPGVEVRVVADTPTVRYVTMTRWTSEPGELVPLFREMLPLPQGHEIRLIQNTEQCVCLVVPLAPAEPETLTDVDLLRRLAPRAAIWATNESLVNTVQFTEAVLDILGGGVEAELASTTTTVLAETQAISLTFAVLGETEAAATTTTVVAEAEATALEAEAIATTTTLAAEAEIAAVEAEAAATTTTAAAEAEVTAVEMEAAVTSTTAFAEAEAVAIAAIVLT
jgi:Nitrile hydratase, alpha chain